MINWGLRCNQLLAERANIQKLNIIERTALWYRLERIGQMPEAELEIPVVGDGMGWIDPFAVEPEWTRRQWYQVDQLKGMVLHLQGKLNESLRHIKPKRKFSYG